MKDKTARTQIAELQATVAELQEQCKDLYTIAAKLVNRNAVIERAKVESAKATQTVTHRERTATKAIRKEGNDRAGLRWNDDESALACLMREQGASYAQIAAVVKRTVKGVQDHLAVIDGRKVHGNVAE